MHPTMTKTNSAPARAAAASLPLQLAILALVLLLAPAPRLPLQQHRLLVQPVHAVDASKFRTCLQTAFCKRNRDKDHPDHSARAESDLNRAVFHVVPGSVEHAGGGPNTAATSPHAKRTPNTWTAHLTNIHAQQPLPFKVHVSVLKAGTVRMYIDEPGRKAAGAHPRYQLHQRILEADALQQQQHAERHPHQDTTTAQVPTVSWTETASATDNNNADQTQQRWQGEFTLINSSGPKTLCVLSIQAQPFRVELAINGVTAMVANGQGLLQMEQFRPKDLSATAVPAANGDDDANNEHQGAEAPALNTQHLPSLWEETFGGQTDHKRDGPSAIGLDVTFPGSEHVYGIPEHASAFSLQNTNGKQGQHKQRAFSEPFRLFNLDVFEYDLDVPMALYGAVPFLMSHDEDKTVGMLWLNAAETYIDISDTKDPATGNPSKQSHWVSESGILDVYFFVGPTPNEVWQAYALLTGKQALPPTFAVAYHQCRWNYKSEEDVAQVDAGFDEHDIPYDVLWLDIEHTDSKKYFTWDKSLFPTPVDMQKSLASKGRQMVTIVDPHIKRDDNYHVHKDALSKGFYVKKADDTIYEGWCWPGSVSYPDFSRDEVCDYWADHFALASYEGSTPTLWTWNDMNEPSVFNGPELTMPKDNLHGIAPHTVEHRDVHNIYGYDVHRCTERGLRKRGEALSPSVGGERPFVLTRAFFAGSQRYAAVWTGDNMAKWDHLRAAVPMLLSLNVAGIVFSGADVGGFFGDPDAELLTRWYQMAAYQPFFRAHAHIDAKRREPWLFGEPHTSNIRAAIRERYALLPYVYTLFRQTSVSGVPVMRPVWAEFPRDKLGFDMEDQFMLGSALLVHPVGEPLSSGGNRVRVYLPGTSPWYDLKYFMKYQGGTTIEVDTPLDTMPVFQRGGTIVARRERARRSSALMVNDPYTLVVALDEEGTAAGDLYLDDGHSFAYESGVFALRKFNFHDGTLVSTSAGGSESYEDATTVERVVIMGLPQAADLRTVTLSVDGGAVQDLDFTFFRGSDRVVVRKPDAPITANWVFTFA